MTEESNEWVVVEKDEFGEDATCHEPVTPPPFRNRCNRLLLERISNEGQSSFAQAATSVERHIADIWERFKRYSSWDRGIEWLCRTYAELEGHVLILSIFALLLALFTVFIVL